MGASCPSCGCNGIEGYCCGSVGPLVENYVDSLTLGKQSQFGGWSLVELVSTPLLIVPCDGSQWQGSLYAGSYVSRFFPCFAANYDYDSASGTGTQLAGQWNTVNFGPYDFNTLANTYSMSTNAGMSFFFDTSIRANVPLVGTQLTAVRGPLLFQINVLYGAGSLFGTPPSGRQALLSSTTFNVKVNDGLSNNQPYGVLTLRNAPVAQYCWPAGSPCNWASATLTNGQWVRSGQPTETQNGAASFMFDSTYNFWYLNVPYTSTSGSGVWKIRETTNGIINVYRNASGLPSDAFTVPSTCNGAISMNSNSNGTNSVLSFTVSNSTACDCDDG